MSKNISYRYPTENRILIFTVVIILLALLIPAIPTLGFDIPIILLFLGINYLFVRARIEGLKRSAVRVGKAQFPEIQAIIDECANRLRIPNDIDVFISQSPELNAFAVGVGRPRSIVLYSALVQALDRDELKSVIGHEMGHIKYNHTGLLTFVGHLGDQTFGMPIIGDLIGYVFLFWMRATEFTADRAGLIACGNLEKAIATEVKLGVGPELFSRINLHELSRQARESRGNLLGMLGEMEGTHPMMTTRIQQMVKFAHSDAFRRTCPEADINFQEAKIWQTTTGYSPRNQQPLCSNCGQPITSPTATFCAHCGAKLIQEPLRCSQCKEPLEATWKVCPRCGKRLKESTT